MTTWNTHRLAPAPARAQKSDTWLGLKDGKVVATFDSRGAAYAALDQPFNKRTVDSVAPAAQPTADRHGNVQAREGCDRCPCGCKYWENDRCIDCGSAWTLDLRGADFTEDDLGDALEASARTQTYESLVWAIFDRVEPTLVDVLYGPGAYRDQEAAFQQGWDQAKYESENR